jgi:hypothetical protein
MTSVPPSRIHAFVTPLESIFRIARVDLSWRPFTHPEQPAPSEIVAIGRYAQGLEAFNARVTDLRDRFLVGDVLDSIRRVLSRMDAEIVAQKRRLTPIGGSDSHDQFMSATTWVLARDKSAEAIREAVTLGRTCVRDAAACSFEARAIGSEWTQLGGAISAKGSIEARASAGPLEVFDDGKSVATSPRGEAVTVAVEGDRCSIVRARVDDGFSAPIYVNCPFATLP